MKKTVEKQEKKPKVEKKKQKRTQVSAKEKREIIAQVTREEQQKANQIMLDMTERMMKEEKKVFDERSEKIEKSFEKRRKFQLIIDLLMLAGLILWIAYLSFAIIHVFSK